MFRCHLTVSVVMLRSRKIRLQPAEELPQSQNSAGNCVEILETMPQGYDCWCIFSRPKSGRCQKLCRRLRQNGIKSITCKTCCATAQALGCYWCLHQRQVVFSPFRPGRLFPLHAENSRSQGRPVSPSTGVSFYCQNWAVLRPIAITALQLGRSGAIGWFFLKIRWWPPDLENFLDQVCCWWWKDCSARKLYFHRRSEWGMAFLEAFFVGRRPPFCPLFIIFHEVSTSALEDGKMIRFGERGTNRWIDGWNQGDLDVDLEDAKAEKNNISTKREGAIRCFFY